MKLTQWYRDEKDTSLFIAYCQLGDEKIRELRFEATTEDPEVELLNKCVKLMSKVRVDVLDAGDSWELAVQFYEQTMNEPASETPAPTTTSIGQNTKEELIQVPGMPTDVIHIKTEVRPSLVDRIANDGYLRIKLTPVQKRVIRMVEAQNGVLFQCNSCEDHPFFMKHALEPSPCPWCKSEVKPHKHQPHAVN